MLNSSLEDPKSTGYFRGHKEIIATIREGRRGQRANSSKGDKEVVQLLLEQGADVSVQEGDDGNALVAASSGGHEHIVQFLAEKGDNVNA
ncbi:hypothetical protein N7486_008695 [Penicillium sp. IBT 16267x]|nr:hypothetical protein N7486_008695 [Penicillium sp. IBT 16267x]